MSTQKMSVFLIIFLGTVFLLGFYTGTAEVISDFANLKNGVIDVQQPVEEKEASKNEQQPTAESILDDEELPEDSDEEIAEFMKKHEASITIESDGEKIVTNVLDNLVLVNKEHNVLADFIPPDLIVPAIPFSFAEDIEKRYLRVEAARALEKLVAKAKEDQVELVGVSGYRSYKTQEKIFANNVKRRGSAEEANKTSARPGQSEHQTGLAMDVSSASIGYQLEQSFGDTKEGQWLAKNAAEFGFIIRYPEGKTNITGYSYEPWHLRYVGAEHAKEMAKRNITLEEYLQQ